MWALRRPAYSARHARSGVSTPVPFWDAVHEIRRTDGRYAREAYAFVLHALGVVAEKLPESRRQDPARRHLSGQELLAGALDLARAEFGVLAPMVFREWGVLSSEDFGRMVFQLVESGQLSARPEDSLDDFRGVADLPAALSEGGRRGAVPPGPAAI